MRAFVTVTLPNLIGITESYVGQSGDKLYEATTDAYLMYLTFGAVKPHALLALLALWVTGY